jgi:cell division protein FtsI/penicillin-binding protein 2
MPIKTMQESAGQISSKIPYRTVQNLDDFPRIDRNEKRMFGIGQGSLRATVLQVANAMASIARGGVFKNPKLFITDSDDEYELGETIGVRPETVSLIRDGMHAVVYETGGTAQTAFRNRDMDQRDVTVYGKTGSTQTPATAWFAGFAEDSSERCVAIAIVIEGGTSGSKDAAPLGAAMIEMCNEMGYVGKNIAGEYAQPDSQ